MSLCSVPISILCVIVIKRQKPGTLSLGLLLSLSHDYCYNNCEHAGNEDCYCDEDGAAACSLGILFFILEYDLQPRVLQGMEPRSLGRGVGAAAEEAPP